MGDTQKTLTAVQFADQSGFNKRQRFAVNMQYKGVTKTHEEWVAELKGKYVLPSDRPAVQHKAHATTTKSSVTQEAESKSTKSNKKKS